MFFNSWQFIVFFAVVYTTYVLLRRPKWQNLLLLVASYYFYAAWDWRFLGLILLSTVVDYFAGLRIVHAESYGAKRRWVTLSIATNLGILGFFKYFNFFADNLAALLASVGMNPDTLRLDIVLPVGISFYTFQTMSYTIDIYRDRLRPTRNFLDFALFVAFFPQLVAGPIERARALLPQIQRPRIITREALHSGAWLIYWGLWKKIVVADNLAFLVDPVFDGSAHATAAQAYLGVFAFAFQIYCDFSGYSDVARGIARVMGFELMRNFDLPYFAVNPSDFWRRWHISLSTWLRDYLYIPLGGNMGGTARMYRNLFLTMLLGGLWHGAAWNYVWWGIYHGLLLIAFRVAAGGTRKVPVGAMKMVTMVRVFVMFQLTLFGWLLFRATRRSPSPDGTLRDDSLGQILEMLTSMHNGWGFTGESLVLSGQIAFFVLPLMVVQWLQYRSDNHYVMSTWSLPVRSAFLGFLSWMWLLYGVQRGTAFIYFQF